MPFLHGTLRIVRARAPRRWSIAPHRASTRSEGVERCSTSCEHCSEGVEHCSTSCEHALRGSGTLLHVVRALLRGRGTLLHVVRALLRGRGALLHVVRARLQLSRSTEPPGGLIRTFDTKPKVARLPASAAVGGTDVLDSTSDPYCCGS